MLGGALHPPSQPAPGVWYSTTPMGWNRQGGVALHSPLLILERPESCVRKLNVNQILGDSSGTRPQFASSRFLADTNFDGCLRFSLTTERPFTPSLKRRAAKSQPSRFHFPQGLLRFSDLTVRSPSLPVSFLDATLRSINEPSSVNLPPPCPTNMVPSPFQPTRSSTSAKAEAPSGEKLILQQILLCWRRPRLLRLLHRVVIMTWRWCLSPEILPLTGYRSTRSYASENPIRMWRRPRLRRDWQRCQRGLVVEGTSSQQPA